MVEVVGSSPIFPTIKQAGSYEEGSAFFTFEIREMILFLGLS